jgi:hypothetical protein
MHFITTQQDIIDAINTMQDNDDVDLLRLVNWVMAHGLHMLDVLTHPVTPKSQVEVEWAQRAIMPEMDLYSWSVLPKPGTPGWRKAYLLWVVTLCRAMYHADLPFVSREYIRSRLECIQGIAWTVNGPVLDRWNLT